jgi:hypothetical protein
MPKKKPYVAKVALEMKLAERRYFTNGVPLRVRTRGNGSSVPIAISRAVRLAFKDPLLKRKSPAYIDISVTVLSRWVLDDSQGRAIPLRE